MNDTIEDSKSGMGRLNKAEVKIGILEERTNWLKVEIKDIKETIKNIFDRLNKIEVRIAFIVSVVTIIINLVFKYLP